MKKLYLECKSGISGDMFVAAMLDLGIDEKKLQAALNTIPIKGFEVKISRVNKMGLGVCDFDVRLSSEYENHDDDMEYLFGHIYGHEGHVHEDIHNHEDHVHEDVHNHEIHHHVHRGIAEIFSIIDGTCITDTAKLTAKKIFTVLGEAEAKAHNKTIETVHFHEVGAVDSIVDIIAAAFCIDELGVEEVIVPMLSEGVGTIRCAHGILPVPVPAVVNIVEKYGINIKITDMQGELITPTGAAIAASIATCNKLPDNFRLLRCGMGAGKREYEIPSILRAMLIEDVAETSGDIIYKLETNIDDITGENLGYVMNLLFQAGARDVCYIPIYMKKNRPAYQLEVICDEDMVNDIENIIFRETTTIGIRHIAMRRNVLDRAIREYDTSLGKVNVKICDIEGRKRFYPEYESVTAICRNNNMSYKEAYHLILEECYDRVDE